MITVWGRQSSSNVQVVLWCLEELSLEYQRIDAGFTYGVVNTPEYLTMNPNGTVPTIKDDDDPVIWESGAILRYLVKRYAGAPFWPDDIVQQTRVDRWAEWSKINVALNFTSPVFWKVVRTAPSQQDHKAIKQALDTLHVKLAIADAALTQSNFLAGDHLTMADLQLGHVLFRYFDIEIERQPLPALENYYQGLTERQAYQQTVMHSYEELRVTDC